MKTNPIRLYVLIFLTSSFGYGQIPVLLPGRLAYTPFDAETDAAQVKIIGQLPLQGTLEDMTSDGLNILVKRESRDRRQTTLSILPLFSGAELPEQVLSPPTNTVFSHATFSPDRKKILYSGRYLDRYAYFLAIVNVTSGQATVLNTTGVNFAYAGALGDCGLKWVGNKAYFYLIAESRMLNFINLNTLEIPTLNPNAAQQTSFAAITAGSRVRFIRQIGMGYAPGNSGTYITSASGVYARRLDHVVSIDLMGWPDGSVMPNEGRTTLYFFSLEHPAHLTTFTALQTESLRLQGNDEAALNRLPTQADFNHNHWRQTDTVVHANVYRPIVNPVTGATLPDTTKPVAICRILSHQGDSYQVGIEREYLPMQSGDVLTELNIPNTPVTETSRLSIGSAVRD